MAGGQFFTKYPEYAAKSLEMSEKNVTGPAPAELALPSNRIYVGAVMMNRDTYELVDISSRYSAGKALTAQVPKGNWKVMLFFLDPTLQPASEKGGVADYLDATAMDKFISLTYQRVYDHVGEFFGKQIKFSFWDEPAMHPIDGRMWTPSFNDTFQKQFGYSPMKYYPALWYNIGPQTTAARNALVGMARPPLLATKLCREDRSLLRGPRHQSRRSLGSGRDRKSGSGEWRFHQTVRTSGAFPL